MLSFIQSFLSIAKDLLIPAHPERILNGNRLFRPFLSYQNRWLTYCYPGEKINTKQTSWWHLYKYVLPLILKHASSYHIEGIKRLNLDTDIKPEFNTFKTIFAAESGFHLEPVEGELSSLEYFKLIIQKKIPCTLNMRPYEELFCGFEPDFWHEAIGHIAPFCFKEVQDFYLSIAEFMLSVQHKAEYDDYLSIVWTLTEYSFLMENEQYKMFGAALISSHLAHMRWKNKMITIEPANRTDILKSQMYVEGAPIPRHQNGKLLFFYLNNLNYS